MTLFTISLVAGCAGGSNNTPNGCPTACVAPMVCNPQTHICVAGGGQCPLNQLRCGAECADTLSDRRHCGRCNRACGPNGTCINGDCACIAPFQNCDAKLTNGCECNGGCTGAQCQSTSPTTCDPAQTGACPGADEFCDRTINTCVPCPQGTKNCDQFDVCECESVCENGQCKGGPGICDPNVVGICGGEDVFCDTATRKCINCAGGYANCTGGNGCACTGLCKNNQCWSCSETVINACESTDNFCGAANPAGERFCEKCQDGKQNCDGTGVCECTTGCNGTKCVTTGCDPSQAGACGGEGNYCDSSSKTCKACAGSSQNCDRKDDCECAAGGSCSGSNCILPECTPAVGCGEVGKYCNTSNKCVACTSGKQNCDQKGGTCECSNGCNGTACAAAPTCTYNDTGACNNDDSQWCYQGACRSCTSGFFNCDNTQGCECAGGCNGTACTGCIGCSGCCDNGTCIATSSQTSYKCGYGNQDCKVCPVGTFCKSGKCESCLGNCAGGCCNASGDCLMPGADQSDYECGKNGQACQSCDPGLGGYCGTGVCYFNI